MTDSTSVFWLDFHMTNVYLNKFYIGGLSFSSDDVPDFSQPSVLKLLNI